MNISKLMIAVVAAPLIAGASGLLAQQPGGAPGGVSVGQTAPKAAGGGQTTGQPAAPGGAGSGTPETRGGNNAVEERAEQSLPNRTGETQPHRNRETTGQAPQNGSRENQGTERRESRTEGNKATNGATEERRLEQNRATKDRERERYKETPTK